MDDATPHRPRPPLGRLAILLAVALAIRLLPVLAHGAYPVLFMDSDSWGYHRLASNLLAGHGYSWDTSPPYSPNLYRPPGFPVVLLGLYALTAPSVPAAIVLLGIVSTATVLLTYCLARALTGRPGLALGAAAVQAMDPVAMQYSNLLLTETLTAPLILLAVWSVVRYRATYRAIWLLAAGGILAAGILIHPVLLFLPFLLPVVPLFKQATRCWRQVAVAAGAAAIALVPASGWIVRNWYVGDFLGISSVTAVNMLKYKAAGVEAELRGTSREVERDRLTAECEAELTPRASPGERYRLWQRRGSAIVLAHPLVYAKVHARGMMLELIGPERDHSTRLLYGPAVLDQEGRYTDASTAAARNERPARALDVARYLILAWQGVLLLALVVGAGRLVRARPALLALLAVVPLYVLTLSGGPESSPRFRVLYLPIFSLLTALGMEALLAAIRAYGSRPFTRSAERAAEIKPGHPPLEAHPVTSAVS